MDETCILQNVCETGRRYEATLQFREPDVRDEYIEALQDAIGAICDMINEGCEDE